MEDPNLRKLWDHVRLVVTADLFSHGRMGAIWRLNTSESDYVPTTFDRDAIGLPGVPVTDRSYYSCYGVPFGGTYSGKIGS